MLKDIQKSPWDATYEPFGKATVTTATVTNNLRFPGQYYDAETGLHYNWHRYYWPEVGRYVEADPGNLGIIHLPLEVQPLRNPDSIFIFQTRFLSGSLLNPSLRRFVPRTEFMRKILKLSLDKILVLPQEIHPYNYPLNPLNTSDTFGLLSVLGWCIDKVEIVLQTDPSCCGGVRERVKTTLCRCIFPNSLGLYVLGPFWCHDVYSPGECTKKGFPV